MNREIKFRAFGSFGSDTQERMISNWESSTYIEDIGLDGSGFFNIMQYTGLKDKNGKDIYEGDICRTYNIDDPLNIVCTVVFDDGSFVFQNDYKLSAELRGFKSYSIEIIGNIYENANLLVLK